MKTIEDKLSIIITTYNRPVTFDKTLESLANSPIKNCRITILDNHSTGETRGVYEKYADQFADISFHSHKINLGGGCENYIHAIDYCDTEYMWILADDDTYNFDVFTDVEEQILKGDVDIIQVGAHNDGNWDWGVTDTPRNLYNKGYKFFKYSSFLPCTIFRYDYFCKYIKQAYDYIHYRYPHFPSLISAFNNNDKIYVSKHQIVTATVGVQEYSYYIPVRGFIAATEFLKDNASKRYLCKSVFNDTKALWQMRISILYNYSDKLDTVLLDSVLKKIMTLPELIMSYLLYYPIVFYWKFLKPLLKKTLLCLGIKRG